LRLGARQLLTQAVEMEAEAFLVDKDTMALLARKQLSCNKK
jgi:hypothetical protein